MSERLELELSKCLNFNADGGVVNLVEDSQQVAFEGATLVVHPLGHRVFATVPNCTLAQLTVNFLLRGANSH